LVLPASVIRGVPMSCSFAPVLQAIIPLCSKKTPRVTRGLEVRNEETWFLAETRFLVSVYTVVFVANVRCTASETGA
jgi:hypothetical protein